MKTIGIVAEFNPFHKGHLHLIEQCKKSLDADRVVVIMSGDFVQRGAPAIMDKFTRTKMALSCGADVVLELPIYYSLGSAEYFASGAVSILDSLGCIDYLCFGSECGDISRLTEVAKILADEPVWFKDALSENLREGLSFAKARQNALRNDLSSVLASPNNILAIAYIKALILRGSNIKPFTLKRIGAAYNSTEVSEFSSATAIRELMLSKTLNIPAACGDNRNLSDETLSSTLPASCAELIINYPNKFATTIDFSKLLWYKLTLEKNNGFSDYLDITEDLSNKLISAVEKFTSFDDLCFILKSKELAYSRISRSLMHILLDIRADKMALFKADNYTGYARILGAKKGSFDLLKVFRTNSGVPVIGNLKEANSLSGLQKDLFDSTILSSNIYTGLFFDNTLNEYKQPLILM